MSNRQGKCPGCGLVNPPEVFECRCCGFVLRARAREKSSRQANASAGLPRGLVLLLIILVMGGGGFLWRVTREDAAQAEPPAEATEAVAEDATPSKRSGPPSLGDRPGSDAGRRRRAGAGETTVGESGVVGMLEQATREHERDVYGEKEAKRAAEARARAARKKQAESSWLGR